MEPQTFISIIVLNIILPQKSYNTYITMVSMEKNKPHFFVFLAPSRADKDTFQSISFHH